MENFLLPGRFCRNACAVWFAAQIAGAPTRGQLSPDQNWRFHPGDIPPRSVPCGLGVALTATVGSSRQQWQSHKCNRARLKCVSL